MKTYATDQHLTAKHSTSMGGVFSLSDLNNLLNETNATVLYRRIRRLIGTGSIGRFVRGFYTSSSPDLKVLCMRLHEDSSISLGSALAEHLMIGTVPAKTVFAVKTGRNRTYAGLAGRIVYAGMQPELMFGYEMTNGIRMATPEKALLDTLYLYLKGRRLYFNPYSDINLDTVNESNLHGWLTRYRNPRFVAFVEGFLDERIRR